jgi:hypothetical protein
MSALLPLATKNSDIATGVRESLRPILCPLLGSLRRQFHILAASPFTRPMTLRPTMPLSIGVATKFRYCTTPRIRRGARIQCASIARIFFVTSLHTLHVSIYTDCRRPSTTVNTCAKVCFARTLLSGWLSMTYTASLFRETGFPSRRTRVTFTAGWISTFAWQIRGHPS